MRIAETRPFCVIDVAVAAACPNARLHLHNLWQDVRDEFLHSSQLIATSLHARALCGTASMPVERPEHKLLFQRSVAFWLSSVLRVFS